MKILVFYITEAITTSTIIFSYRQKHYIDLFKYIELLHISRKRKIVPSKLLNIKFLAVFATPKEFPGGADDDLLFLFHNM